MKKNDLFQEYLFLIFILFLVLSRNTIFTASFIGFKLAFIILTFFFSPIIFLYIKRMIYEKNKFIKNNILILIFNLSILISIFIKFDFTLYNFTTFLMINFAYIYSKFIDINFFKKKYIFLFAFLSLSSLINIFIVKNSIIDIGSFDSIKSSCLFFKNSANVPFSYIFTSFVVWIPNYIRNFSIFTEPAFFQFYILISMLFTYFSNYKIKYKLLLILLFSVTMISTFSSAGLIILLLFYLFIFIELIKRKKIKFLLCGLTFMIVCLLLSIKLFPSYFDELFNAFNKIISSNDSSNARVGSIIFSIQNFIFSPIFGNKILTILSHENITNTIFSFFAIYGIIPGSVISYLCFKFASCLSSKRLEQYFILIFLILSTSNHLFIGVSSFWLILFSVSMQYLKTNNVSILGSEVKYDKKNMG